MKNNFGFLKKFFIIATIVFILVFVVAGVSYAVSGSIDNEANQEPDINSFTKTTQWTNNKYTEGKVELTAEATGRGVTTPPKVLFLGTLCGYHGLTKETIYGSLEAVAQNADVDYYFLGRTASESTDCHDKLNRGNRLTSSQKGTIENKMMGSKNHHALGKFLTKINDLVNTTTMNYDYIVLETDGTLIAHNYGVNDDDDFNPYISASVEKAAANKLKQYYQKNKVIWIHQNIWDECPASAKTEFHNKLKTYKHYYTNGRYFPCAYYCHSSYTNLTAVQFNSMCALYCPDVYKPAKNGVRGELNIETDLSDRVNGVNLGDREALYGDTASVVNMLDVAIKQDFKYSLTFKDTLRYDQGLKIKEDPVTKEKQIYFMTKGDEEGADWVRYTGTDTTISVNPSTQEISATLPNLGFHTQVKLVIEFESSGGSGNIDFKGQSKTGDPNKGNLDYGRGKGSVTLTDVNSTTRNKDASISASSYTNNEYLQWPVTVTYDVDDGLTQHENTVSSPSENLKTNSKSATGSTATAGNAWQFKGWYKKGDASKKIVSTDAHIAPGPDSGPIGGIYVTGRYHDCGFVALFVLKDCNVSYQYKDPVPSSAVIPEGATVKAKSTYTVATPAGVADYVFDGWYYDQSCTGTKVNPGTTVTINDDTVFYGKWTQVSKVTIKYEVANPDGGSVSPVSEQVLPKTGNAQGSTATVNDHYHFTGWTLKGSTSVISTNLKFKPTRPATGWPNETTYVAHFAIDTHTLKIHYIDEAGKPVPGTTDVNVTKEYGWHYKYESPVVEGYSLKDSSQEIIEDDLTGDTEIDVVYTLNKHDLVIHYQSESGATLADDHEEIGKNYGSSYNVTSPSIAGYHLTDSGQTVVKGTMPDDDVEITVKYTENDKVTIKYEADTGGSVSPESESLAPATGVAQGSTATPDPGYVFVNWTHKVDGKDVKVGTNAKFTPQKVGGLNVADTYTAHFEFKPTIEKTAESSVNAGERINYTITVTNGTGGKIENATITDPVPSGLSDIQVEDGGTYSDGVVRWEKSIPVSGLELHFNALSPKNISETKTITNEASLAIGSETITAKASTKVIPLVTSFLINKVWNDGTVKHVDDSITINLYKNSLDSIVGSYKLDKNSFVESVPWATETEKFNAYDESGQFINYFIRELDADGYPVEDHQIFEYGKDKYTASYSYSYDAAGIMVGATATNTYNVVAKDLSINKTGDKTIAKPGDSINYTIVVNNNASGGSAANIVVEDPIPEGLMFVSASDEGVFDGKKVIWKIPKLGANESKTLNLTCKVPDGEREKEYRNVASITSYGDEIPSEIAVTKQDLTPPERHDVSCDIRKSILRYDEEGNEQDYLFTNEKIGGTAILRYYCFKYVATKLDKPVIEDTLPYGLEPVQANAADYTLETEYNEVTGRYKVTLNLTKPLTEDRTDVDLPVKIKSDLTERTTMISDSTLKTQYEEKASLSARSNETEMLVDVAKPVDPIPVPKPVVTDVKKITANKVWSDGADAHKNDSVEVSLLADGKVKDVQTLSTANNWTYTWDKMPLKTDVGTIIKYSLEETKGKDGYSCGIMEDASSVYNVTNTKIEESVSQGTSAQTGDQNILIIGMLLFACSLVCLRLFRKSS